MQVEVGGTKRGWVVGSLAAFAIAVALPAPGAEADAELVIPHPVTHTVKPQPATSQTITPVPVPQPESAPGPPGDATPGATPQPEHSLPYGIPDPAVPPVPLPNLASVPTPVPDLMEEGELGEELTRVLIAFSGEEYLLDSAGLPFLRATMLAQGESPSNPHPLVDIPMEMNLIPMPRALKTIAGVWLVEKAIGAASKTVATAKCGNHKIDDNGVSYCPK